MAKSPTFILVPGHWHTTQHMQPLLSHLTQNHFRARTIQLHSVGLKTPRPTFQDDVQVIYSACSAEMQAGHDVFLVLHSFAGMSGAEAINRLIASGEVDGGDGKGKLVRAVFIAAYTLPAGVVLDAMDHVGPLSPNFSIDDDGLSRMANPRETFFNDMSAEDAQPWIDKLDHAYYLGPHVVISSEDWRKAPVFALLCSRDNSMPPERVTMIWQGVESEWMNAGHTPYVSQTEKVAEILVRLIEM